jgi:hypothetical protein
VRFAVVQKSVFVQGTPFVQAAVRKRGGLDLEGFCLRSLHCLQLKGRRTLSHRPFRYDTIAGIAVENAISIPNIAKLVIKLKPP